MQVLLDSAAGYAKEAGRHLWTDLLAWEKDAGERFVASTGQLDWTVSFAPKGMAGEIDFYLPRRQSIFALTDGDICEFLDGLTRVFAYFKSVNLISFNMTLYATLRDDGTFPLHGRIVPRFLILPLGTSDINYFEKLHDEIICPIIPEQICGDLKPYFQTEGSEKKVF
jgi:UDPglucose--hexose-1-phosphate uridylyltransferase